MTGGLLVGRRKRAHDVAEQLEAMIGTGEFEIGSQLPSEKDLMTRFGVGRPAVREALFLLQQQGLLELQSGIRARVVPPTSRMLVDKLAGIIDRHTATPEGQEQMEQTRLLFEAGCAWFAAEAATAEDIARIETALDANVAALGRIPEFIRTDVAFHHEIVATTRNPIFEATHEVMVGWLTEQRTTTIHIPDADHLSIRDHRAIFEAIAAKDPIRAQHEMTTHLKLISRLYKEARRLSDSILRKMSRDVAARVRSEQQAAWMTVFQPAPALGGRSKAGRAARRKSAVTSKGGKG